MVSHSSNRHRYEFTNKISIDLEVGEHGQWFGISRATLAGRPFLVTGRGCCLPYFLTPEGIAYHTFHIRSIDRPLGGLKVECEAVGLAAPVSQNQDLFHFPQIAARATPTVSDILNVHIIERNESVGGEHYCGFEITYEFISDTRKIHWMYESIAFAPDGVINGSRVLAQIMSARESPLEGVLTKSSAYSTAEAYGSLCIQSPPRGGGSPIFDLVQNPTLSVVSYFESAISHGCALRGNCQKLPGEDFLTVSDLHYGKLTSSFRTAPRIVLAAVTRDSSRHTALNRWTSWFDHTSALWRSELGLPPQHKTPSMPMLSLEGTGVGDVDPGCTYPQLLKTWIDRLDWVEAQGFKAINLHTPEWIGAANRETIVFGGNNCCPWEFKLSDDLGGEAGLREFCDACHVRGIKVFIWIAGHLHRESPAWKQHPEWIARLPNQGLWDGLYGVIHSLSFAHGAGDWIANDLKALRAATGFDGVWFDSFAGLVLSVINWQSPDREPNAPAVFDFMRDLAASGIEIMIEGISQLGVSSWGNIKLNEIAGHEELLLNTNMRYFARKQWSDPALTHEMAFRMMAARAPIGVWLWEFLGKPEPFPPQLPAWLARMQHDYNQVVHRMHTRVIHPSGVLWHDVTGEPAVWFPFLDSAPPTSPESDPLPAYIIHDVQKSQVMPEQIMTSMSQ